MESEFIGVATLVTYVFGRFEMSAKSVFSERPRKLILQGRTYERTVAYRYEKTGDENFIVTYPIYEIMECKEDKTKKVVRVTGEFGEDEISEDYYYYLLGQESLEQGQVSEALELFKKSLEISNHFKTLAQISVCYDKLGLADLAFKYLELAYNANPRNDKVAYDFAEKLKRNNSIIEAKEVLKSILSRNSSYKKAKMLLDSLD